MVAVAILAVINARLIHLHFCQHSSCRPFVDATLFCGPSVGQVVIRILQVCHNLVPNIDVVTALIHIGNLRVHILLHRYLIYIRHSGTKQFHYLEVPEAAEEACLRESLRIFVFALTGNRRQLLFGLISHLDHVVGGEDTVVALFPLHVQVTVIGRKRVGLQAGEVWLVLIGRTLISATAHHVTVSVVTQCRLKIAIVVHLGIQTCHQLVNAFHVGEVCLTHITDRFHIEEVRTGGSQCEHSGHCGIYK